MKTRYHFLAGFGLAAVALVFSATSARGQACDGTAYSVDGYTITCVTTQYNTPVADQSRWFYTVTSPLEGTAISHITIQLGLDCLDIIEAGTWGPTTNDLTPGGGDPEEVDPGAQTGLSGLKFDEGFNEGETKNFYFTVTGNPDVGFIEVGFKAGDCDSTDEDPNNDCPSVQVPGPNLQCTPITSLPVELTSFEGRTDGPDVLLTWTTATETNNAGFAVEHAGFDDATFDELAFVEGHGSTFDAKAYSFRATGLLPGLHRFRLKQVDFDGTVSFSPEIETKLSVPENYFVGAAYPNPFNPATSVAFAVAEAQVVRVVLHDVLGRPVRTLFDAAVEADATQQVRIDASDLPSGTYLVHFSGKTFSAARQIVLLK